MFPHEMPDQNFNSPTQSERCECVTSAWRKLKDVRPATPPTNQKCRLWYERVRCSRFDLLLPVLQAFLVLLDIGLDFRVAAAHYQHGDYNWAAYTITIVVVTEVFLQAVSVFFFIEDKNNKDKDTKDALEENGLEVKPWVLICHLFPLGRFVRLYQTWKVARKIRSEGYEDLENDVEARRRFNRRHCLYLKQMSDINILGLIEAFLENAPQVMLQFYILLGQSHVDLTSRDDLLVTLNIVKSLLLFAFGHLSYTRSLRKQDPESGQLALFSKGAVSLYLWRFFMLVSRVLVLALFASTFVGYFTALLIALRFLVFLGIVAKQKCEFFEDNPTMQKVLKLAFAYIHVFSFFPLIFGKTQKLGIVYYGITFVENSVILVLWFLFSSWGVTFKLTAVVVEKISFFVGLLCLALYYRCFHPSIVKTTGSKGNVDGRIKGDSGTKYLCVSNV